MPFEFSFPGSIKGPNAVLEFADGQVFRSLNSAELPFIQFPNIQH